MGKVAQTFDGTLPAIILPAITQIVNRLEQKKFLTRVNDQAYRCVYAL